LLYVDWVAHDWTRSGGTAVSIVRVGLAETKKFAEGYDAIFGSKKKTAAPKKKAKAAAKTTSSRKKKKKK
jgi:hypothetical protein